MDIHQTLNELLVGLFHNIMQIEEKAIRSGSHSKMTANDMHVIEAIGLEGCKNMSAVSKSLGVTMGTLTTAVNALVKKGYVERVRSEEDRRVVLVSLSQRGKEAYRRHEKFHQEMISQVIADLNSEEQKVLQKALGNLNAYFADQNMK